MANNNNILITFLSIFLLLGFIMPYVNEEFNTTASYSSHDIEHLVDELGQKEFSDVTGFEIFFSITTIFFWTFGNLPLIIDIALIIPRIIFMIILYDKARGIN